jgi:predicted aminopeptidase
VVSIVKACLIVLLGLLVACNEMQYYQQSVQGHLDIIGQATDIEQLLADDSLNPQVREKLLLVLQARAFAVATLQLSVNDSYTEYVDLKRGYVVENLYAAEEFSTQLVTWCYPVIGCASYRGYFDAAMLQRYRDELIEQGYDTYVGHVTAYSTLGWFDDPVLNTFIALPDYRLVGLIFHELAHQQLYIDDDTVFNESFATAVEQAGMEMFYAAGDDANQLSNYRAYRHRVNTLVAMAAQARQELQDIYQQPLSLQSKRQAKARVLGELDRQYALMTGKSGTGSHTPVPVEFNNARLGAMGAYHQQVPAFLQILASHERDFAQFYAHVARLGRLAADERGRCLDLWGEKANASDTVIPTLCR